MQLRLVVLAMLFIVPACMAPLPTPTLELKYAPTSLTTPSNNITLTLIKPRYAAIPLVSNDLEKEVSPIDTVHEIYSIKQSPRLQGALDADLRNIFIAKGFLVSKASDSFYDLSPTDRQKIDLIVVPVFDLRPLVENNQNVYHYPTGTTRVINTGTVQLIGSLTIEFIEPTSQQKLLTKKVDVMSLSANAPVEYEDQAEAETKFLLLLNKVYPRLMKKIDESIQANELRAVITQSRR
jgi:hypothetical protein